MMCGTGLGIPDTRRVRGWDNKLKPVGYRVRDWGDNTRTRPAPLPCLVPNMKESNLFIFSLKSLFRAKIVYCIRNKYV